MSAFFQTRPAAASASAGRHGLVTRAAAAAHLATAMRPNHLIQTESAAAATITNATAKPSAVIVGWDNVLFPTKWMVECAGIALSSITTSSSTASKKSLHDVTHKCAENPFLAEALAAIEKQVIALLAAASAVAPVFILSDQPPATVNATCAAFFPRLRACLANARGRVQVMGPPSASLSATERATWKLSILQQICSASMAQQQTRAAVGQSTAFKVLTVSADEMEIRAAARLQEMAARAGSGSGCIQSLPVPVAMSNGKPLSLVDFHKQLQQVAHVLAGASQATTL